MTTLLVNTARQHLSPVWAMRVLWLATAIIAWLWQSEFVTLIQQTRQTNLALQITVYCTVYATLAGLTVPGAVLLTVLAGPLFGPLLGTAIASFASTSGASLAFLSNRHLFSTQLEDSLALPPKINKKLKDSHWNPNNLGAKQLLFLRLVPIFPFFAVNMLTSQSQMSLRTFWCVSQLGMLPATILVVYGGAALVG